MREAEKGKSLKLQVVKVPKVRKTEGELRLARNGKRETITTAPSERWIQLTVCEYGFLLFSANKLFQFQIVKATHLCQLTFPLMYSLIKFNKNSDQLKLQVVFNNGSDF